MEKTSESINKKMQRKNRRRLTILACLIALTAICFRIYFELVPRGASIIPFVGFSRELQTITSPTGQTFQVFVNDAGGMHSGNHTTWVVDRHWLTGRYVVMKGYVTPACATGKVPLVVRWNGDQPVVQFEKGRN